MKKSAEDRFWEKVNKTETCWLWTGSIRGGGYGKFSVDKKMVGVHRFSWILHYGSIPAVPDTDYRGTCVLHKCDVPSCVRPDHLFLGSNLDNVRDRDLKGRAGGGSLPGEKQAQSKLNTAQVLEIRTCYKTGLYTQKDLSRTFGVSQPVISLIINRKDWTHVD